MYSKIRNAISKNLESREGRVRGPQQAMANARRLEVEVRVELRHAAHGCPMKVDTDLTCEQPSISGYRDRNPSEKLFSLSVEIRNMSCPGQGSSEA
jgi:hypothetical protein